MINPTSMTPPRPGTFRVRPGVPRHPFPAGNRTHSTCPQSFAEGRADGPVLAGTLRADLETRVRHARRTVGAGLIPTGSLAEAAENHRSKKVAAVRNGHARPRPGTRIAHKACCGVRQEALARGWSEPPSDDVAARRVYLAIREDQV